jgi:hypothetical protein
VSWIASEVFAWLEARPRRQIGHLKQVRAAQETGKEAKSPRDKARAKTRPRVAR